MAVAGDRVNVPSGVRGEVPVPGAARALAHGCGGLGGRAGARRVARMSASRAAGAVDDARRARGQLRRACVDGRRAATCSVWRRTGRAPTRQARRAPGPGGRRSSSLTAPAAPSRSASRVVSQRRVAGRSSGSRRRRISRSVTTSVPAARLVRAGRQPDGADEVGQGGHLAAGGRVGGVHRVAAGEHGDQAAGAGQRAGT